MQLAVDALPGKTFEGTVDRIAPVVDSGSGTFRVVCAFDGGGVLQPGMFGRIRIDYDQRADALVVPRIALLEDEGEPAVFVVRGGKAVRAAGASWATSTASGPKCASGLKAGDQVVTAGKVALREGSAVQVIGDEPAAKRRADSAAEQCRQPRNEPTHATGHRRRRADAVRTAVQPGRILHPPPRHRRDGDADACAVRPDRAVAASRSTCCPT